MAVIFVNRFYWPDEPATGQLLTDLAEALAQRGLAVQVIASHSGAADLPESEERHGVRIHRVRSARGRSASRLRKALDFGSFFFAALARLRRVVRSGDIVVAMTDPPLLGLGAAAIARRRRATLVHWIQDIYPELAIELAGQRWLRLLQPWRDRSWRSAAACVTLGTDMAAAVTRAGVSAKQLHIVENWAPAGIAEPPAAAIAAQRVAWGVGDACVVAYSGNLGRVHDLEPVLAGAAALRDEPGVVFLFIGGGAQRARVEAAARERGLRNVRFLPAQPRATLAASLAAADLHLVTLRPGCEAWVYPSKLYGIAAVARPILFVGPPECEVARVVRDRDLGRAVPREDPRAFAAAVRELCADRVRREWHATAAREFSSAHRLAHAAARWHDLLRALPAAPSSAAPLAVSRP